MNPSPRLRRWLIAAAICFVLFSVVGFFVLPPIIKSQAEQRLTAALGRTVTLGKVRVNPYALSLTLENFDIREKDGRASFLGWDRLYVNFDLLSSLTGDWVLSDIELDGFHAAVAINPDGSFNFSDLLAKFTASTAAAPGTAPAKPMRPVRIGRLAVSRAQVDFSDRSRKHPFASVIGPVTFVLTGFRTAGAHGAPYHFEAVTESGERLAWTGTLSADPLELESHGEFAVENLILKKYTPYFEDKVRADLTGGKLTVRGHYEAALDAQKRILKLADGEVHLRDLRINERATGQPAVELPTLDVTGIQADAVAFKATVGSVALAGGTLTVRREKDGSINLLTMLTPEVSPGPVQPTAAPAALPDVRVGEIALKGFEIDVTDNAAPRPAQLAVASLQLSLKNVTLADGAVMPLQLSFAWAPRGKVQVAGSVMLKPTLTADLKTEAMQVEILPLSPYLEQFINARFTQGKVSTANTVHLAMSAGRPAVTFEGGFLMENFGLVDSAHNEELAGFTGLTISGVKASTSPRLAVSVGEINFSAPYARVFVNADKSINLLTIMRAAEPASAPPPGSPAPAAPPPRIEIGRIVLSEGDFSFADRSIEPNVRMGITQFYGSVIGLSSENLARGRVDLNGTVDGAGPVSISGQLDPLGASKYVNLKVDFKNVDLLPISPYTGKFAGYELARGKLVVDTKILVDGEKLDATNVITLNQFTFGAATNSPDATGLPVRLGVTLLKDLDGRIVIDLPIQGSLDDPNFRVGKVVMRVLVNLLTKAATSPFSLLGSMFGGGGDELAFQEFAPGGSELLPAEAPKLDTLIKALTNRPALSLGIEGSYDAVADTYALKRQKFADLVRRQIWAALHVTHPNIAPPDQLVITPGQNAVMVKKLFNQKFPPGTKFGTPLPPEPAVAALPPAPPPGIVKRVINVITFQSMRAERAARQEEARRAAEHEKAVAVASAAGLPLDEMTGRLAETMTVDDNDLRALAAARAQRVRDQLINTGHIAADRLFLSQGTDPAKSNKGPRVFLSLQ